MNLDAADCPALLTTTDAARALGVSTSHLTTMRRADPALDRCLIRLVGVRAKWSTKALRAWRDAPKPVKVSRLDKVLAEFGGGA